MLERVGIASNPELCGDSYFYKPNTINCLSNKKKIKIKREEGKMEGVKRKKKLRAHCKSEELEDGCTEGRTVAACDLSLATPTYTPIWGYNLLSTTF